VSGATLGWLLPAVPAAAAGAGFLLPVGGDRRWSRTAAAGLGILGAGSALVITVWLLVGDLPVSTRQEWVRFGDLPVTLDLSIDRPAVFVALAVGVVALAVQVYSVEYLRADDRYAPYAAQVGLFTAAMLLVVVSGDLILLLVGWEVMGICSYLLIGHDRSLPEAPKAAVKAFVVTRVGDVGFLLGIAVLGISAKSFRLADVLAADHSATVLTAGLLLLLCGVAGKSAQFPLHTWLPDAMAGPTPISALIHAATMVAAGVYVVFRLHPLFVTSTVALTVLGLMAALTILIGALAATAQDDIKKVLAWSTVSQIGYMTGALAVGSSGAALFHLLTHAAFKALLFLAAGAVIHAVGTNLMSRMGGLRLDMPVTFWSMVVGLGALAGVPPLAGFWSKETVLVAAATARDGHGPGPAWVGLVVWLAALLGVAVTAWYATRLLLRTFLGPSRTPDRLAHTAAPPPAVATPPVAAPAAAAPAAADSVTDDWGADDWVAGPGEPRRHPHDPPALMRWPIVLLAIPAAVAGTLATFPSFREELGLDAHLDLAVLLPLALVVLGAGAAGWLWWQRPGEDPAAALGRLQPVFANAFHVDDVQDRLVVRPAYALARAMRRADERIVDGAVEGTGRGASGIGRLLGIAHAGPLPRAAVAVLTGALLFGVLAAVLFGGGA
jgi:NADH-quinone oxidoreductase subunit L